MARIPQLVDSPSPTDGQTLVYDAAAKRWRPGTPSAGGGIQNVSGTVDLPNVAGVYEVYATDAATVEGVGLAPGDAAVFRYLSGSWSHMVLGVHTSWQPAPGSPPATDTTPPTGGNLTVTGSGAAGDTATLTVTGAIDSGSGLHAQPYAFSVNGGTTWSAWQTPSVFTTGSLSTGTYQFRARVRDAAATPNVATLSAPDYTVVGPTLPITDTFTAPDGTLVGGRSVGGFTWSNVAQEVIAFIGRAGAGHAEIVGNKAVGNAANARGAVIDVSRQNVRITATISTTTADRIRLGVGDSIAGAAGSNGLYLDYAGDSASVRWVNGGSAQLIGSGTFARPVTNAVATLEFDGTTATGKINGTTVGSGPVTFAGTKIGFEVAGAGQSVDNFTIEEV